MGSSNKSRKHYKKDSRFVADLYTFTYDDFDLVRDTFGERRKATVYYFMDIHRSGESGVDLDKSEWSNLFYSFGKYNTL